jgi:transcriptional regulator with XRE-family HTH domain
MNHMANSPEYDPKVLLGELLREARELPGGKKTQQEVAALIGKERTTVAKGETGDQVPILAVLEEWLDRLEIHGLARSAILKMHRLARFMELDPSDIAVAPWYPTEARAHTLRYWAPTVVPGIVQMPAYAEELYRAAGFSDAKVKESLQVRLGRQGILTRDDAPDITIVIWEAVLFHHQVGTPEVMRDQCARLLQVSEYPTVSLHILPSDGANAGLGGTIGLAATDDAPELLVSDGVVEDQLTQDPARVRKARATFSRVRSDARNRADSRDVLVEATERWN